jgi:hypothetical protein
MPKSYSKFTAQDIDNLGIRTIDDYLFKHIAIAPIEPSTLLTSVLDRSMKRKLRSEKAKSEHLITPILTEVEEINQLKIACYSGYTFNVEKSLGLVGLCDYIFSHDPKSRNVEAPVFCIVEAKNENIDEGINQCIAEMYAAQVFNKKRNRERKVIYGAVTFGFEWKFLQLIEKEVIVDIDVYYLVELPKLLGVFNYIVNQ